jgi:prefoldin alpha subunit
VDVGCGVFCQAKVPDATRLFISIGLGFHVECTLEEAPRVIKLQKDALQKKVMQNVKQAAEVKAHIKFMVEAIRQLSGL